MNYTEELKSLEKLYRFLKKNTNQLKQKRFTTFIKEIVKDGIFDNDLLLELSNYKTNKNNNSKTTMKTTKNTNSTKKTKIRIMNKVFSHKQVIKHVIGIDEEWIAHYDKDANKIIYNDKIFDSLNKFTQAHYEKARPYRNKKNNAWLECFCLKDDQWISTYDLPEIIY